MSPLLLAALLCLPPAALGQALNAELYLELDVQHSRRAEAGALEAELARLEKARALSPLDSGLLWRHGRALAAAARSMSMFPRRRAAGRALEALDQAVDIDPRLLAARYWRSYVLLERGRYAEAAVEVEKALELAPHDGAVHRLAGEIYGRASRMGVGDRKRAVYELEEGRRLGDGSPSLAL